MVMNIIIIVIMIIIIPMIDDDERETRGRFIKLETQSAGSRYISLIL